MGFANRTPLLGWSAAMLALSSITIAAPAGPERYETGPIFLPCGGGSGPIHRRGRFKRNQRRQRK